MSRTIATITGSYTPDDSNWECLRDSALHNGIKIVPVGPNDQCLEPGVMHVFGRGEHFPHLETFRRLIPYVENLEDDYILHTDAHDVIVNRWDPEEVMQAVDACPSGMLMSCNDECWPAGPWCEAYPENGTPWRTACAGQYVATKAAMLNLWREYLSGHWEQTAGGSTQEMCHRIYADANLHVKPAPFQLDTRCQIFQIMGARSVEHVHPDWDRGATHQKMAINRLTDSIPMFLHFGGRAPGMREWFGRLYA